MLVLKTPILFLVFNRPQHTNFSFNVIKRVKPSKLYIVCDGPRINNFEDEINIKKVKNIVSTVDWKCEIRTLFREKNLGCKYGVSDAISWFFKNEECGIILEDDCIPNTDFFYFCQIMLEKYKYTNEVQAITGQNFQDKNIFNNYYSYYFSIYNHIWGWASWRRAWKNYDVNIKFWPSWKNSNEWKIFCSDKPNFKEYWEPLLDSVHQGKINTWDYQWMVHLWKNNGLCVTPNVNLVSNIGFDETATHTKIHTKLANLQTFSIGNKIKHPPQILLNTYADNYVLNNIYYTNKYNILSKITNKIKIFFKYILFRNEKI